jgi:glycosyltransferase involved in cell wall biosynthesis
MKKSKINIALFWFMNDWGKYGRAYENIAEGLAKLPGVGRVLCMFPPARIRRDQYAWPLSFNHVSAKLIAVTPHTRMVPTITAPFRLRHWMNRTIPDFALRNFMKLLGFREDNTLLWVFPPHNHIEKLVEFIPHQLLITQVVDNNIFRFRDGRAIAFAGQQYKKLSKISDIVITSSSINHRIFSALNERCYLFENAVDRKFIGEPSELPYRVNKARPRLGYVGWITQRTDIALMDYIARARTDYDLIIAGPVEAGENLNKYGTLELRNVSYLGIMPYEKVPGFLNSLDVCLIPHLDTPYSKSMSPLKLLQYLASGRPVVSTPVAGTERWTELISIGRDYKEFVEMIDESLRNDSLEKSRKRIDASKQETWEKRISKMYDVIMQNMPTDFGCVEDEQRELNVNR